MFLNSHFLLVSFYIYLIQFLQFQVYLVVYLVHDTVLFIFNPNRLLGLFPVVFWTGAFNANSISDNTFAHVLLRLFFNDVLMQSLIVQNCLSIKQLTCDDMEWNKSISYYTYQLIQTSFLIQMFTIIKLYLFWCTIQYSPKVLGHP